MRSLRLILVLSLSLFSLSLPAAPDVKAVSEGDAIKSCLAAWGEHPFRSAEEQPFKVLSPSVKVLGVGQDVTDESETDEPQLVLVKPSVNVLTKSNFRLMNPKRVVLFRRERHGAREERDHRALQSAPCEQSGRGDGRGR